MARYTGPKSKIARKFGEAIFGDDKSFEKKNYPPGQHGNNRRRGKKSEYAIQLNKIISYVLPCRINYQVSKLGDTGNWKEPSGIHLGCHKSNIF